MNWLTRIHTWYCSSQRCLLTVTVCRSQVSTSGASSFIQWALLLILSWSSFFCLSCTSLSTHRFYILAVIVKTAHFRHSLLFSAHPRFIYPEQQQPSWFLSLFIITQINMTMWDSNYVITDVAILTLQQCSLLPLPSFYKPPSAIRFSFQQCRSSYRYQLRSMSLFVFFQKMF